MLQVIACNACGGSQIEGDPPHYCHPETTHEWLLRTRPAWWWINPWLYIKRRDIAYAQVLDVLQESRP